MTSPHLRHLSPMRLPAQHAIFGIQSRYPPRMQDIFTPPNHHAVMDNILRPVCKGSQPGKAPVLGPAILPMLEFLAPLNGLLIRAVIILDVDDVSH